MFTNRAATIVGMGLLGCGPGVGGIAKAPDESGSHGATGSDAATSTFTNDSGSHAATGTTGSHATSATDSGSGAATGSAGSGSGSTTGSGASGSTETHGSGTDSTTGTGALTELALLVTGNASGFLEPCG